MNWRVVAGVGVALLGLNVALAHGNAWPTPWPRLTAQISADLAGLIVILALVAGVRGRVSRRLQWAAGVAVVLLFWARYGAVTTGSLFGRPIDVFWEARHLPNVAALAFSAVPWWEWVAGVLVVALGSGLGLLAARWAVGALSRGFAIAWWRRVAIIGGIVVIAWPAAPDWRASPAAAQSFARQASLTVSNIARPRVGLTVVVPSNDRVETPVTGDVVVTFLESYGDVAFTVPEIADRLAPAYDALAAQVADAGWSVTSGWVEAATFGGASWLSHASLLSGAIIGDQRDYLSLLDGDHRMLTDDFGDAGYRTVVLAPGIRDAWPEGAALRFDEIYDAGALAYPGDGVGWWQIPDQYTLAFLADRELSDSERAPVFALFPTIMSHMPFLPVPAYTADWGGALAGAITAGKTPPPGHRGAYGEAMAYNLAMVGGFLAERAPADALVVVAGDHQPPGLVAGPDASWLVPVHVFAKDDNLLKPFDDLGFQVGVLPGNAVAEVPGIWSVGSVLRTMVPPAR